MADNAEISKTVSAPAPAEEMHEDIKKLVSRNDLDVGAKYADAAREEPPTPEEEAAVLWKTDLRLLPILFFNALLSSMDKNSTSTAALYGIKIDCDLTEGNRYALVGSAFFIGYLIASVPAGWALQKYPVAKVIVTCELLWGIVLLASGFISSFPGLLVLRILLGILEAPLVPGGLLIMSMWYTKRDMPLRLGLTITGLAQVPTSLLGYAIGFVDHAWFKPWRLFFWILGGITIVWACFSLFMLPDSPINSSFLSEREKVVAVYRMKADQTGIENKRWKKDQVKEALTDPKTWLLFFFNIFVIFPNGGLVSFSPLIVNGLGYPAPIAALITMPTGVLQTIAGLLSNAVIFLVIRKRGTGFPIRGYVIVVGMLIGMISTVFLYKLPLDNLPARLVALIFSFFFLGPYVASLAFITVNTAGYTKKVVVNSLCFIGYCATNIVGPQFFKNSQAPLYPLGTGSILASYVLGITTMCLYMAYCAYENKRRDGIEGGELAEHEDTDFMDLTDKQNIHFRYVW